ncbi:MAG: L-threonylcarbamoyladenylate synthase [Eubacteriales bacterium]|nr:L-threonylcarbamoyladenylate synthase [Eubacteriales bacterium]
MQTKILPLNKSSLKMAKEILRGGGLVAFPTETVYGLGANALNTDAVKSIFNAKGRPQDNPLIVHLASKHKIKKYVKSINGLEHKIIKKFMPGPISLILQKKDCISNTVTAGLNTVAIRVPLNKQAHKFLKAVNLPISAPSANTSKRPSPTNAGDVFEDMNGKIPLIIDGGSTDVGVESTVVKVKDNTIYILRPGKITAQDLQKATNAKVVDKSILKDGEKPESPGAKYTHYAPKCAMELVMIKNNEKMIEYCLQKYMGLTNKGGNPVILCSDKNATNYKDVNHITIGKNSNQVCSCIFATLRQCEKKFNYIICEFVFGGSMEDALFNRLSKSCGGNIITNTNMQ